MEDSYHHLYRLNYTQAKEELYKRYFHIDNNKLNYIFLFFFDYEEKLIWGDIISPDDPESKLNFIISVAESYKDLNKNNYYYGKNKII